MLCESDCGVWVHHACQVGIGRAFDGNDRRGNILFVNVLQTKLSYPIVRTAFPTKQAS